MILTKLNSSNYDLSDNVWNMESCEFTKQFTEQVACKNREPYIFEQNGKYIACCDLVLDYGEYTQKDIKIYLSRLIVKKELRNDGIGQAVLKNMIDLCKSRGYKYVTLGVDANNKRALHIYEKNGFQIYETAADNHGEYHKMILKIWILAHKKMQQKSVAFFICYIVL